MKNKIFPRNYFSEVFPTFVRVPGHCAPAATTLKYNRAMNDFDRNNLPEAYRPLSMWGYFGYQILFAIPLIGFIFLVVFALGGTSNINLRNFARSYFCALIIVLVILLILMVSGVGAALLSNITGLVDMI